LSFGATLAHRQYTGWLASLAPAALHHTSGYSSK
jgi:hypothetical protein